MAETCYAFAPRDIVKCENAILEFLQWRTLVPVCSDYLKLLLFLANPLHDFTNIIHKVNECIFSVLMQYEMTAFKYSSIAIASLIYVCEKLGYKTFQTGILELIDFNNFQFDSEETLQCQEAIEFLMSQRESANEFAQPDCKKL